MRFLGLLEGSIQLCILRYIHSHNTHSLMRGFIVLEALDHC